MSKKTTTPKGVKNVCVNRKARFKFEISDTFEAGLVLKGSEVKSLRDGRAHLTEAYVTIAGNQAWLLQAHIATYVYANQFNHEPDRRRKLLLHRRQIIRLKEQIREKGLTLVPMRLYFKDGRAKLEFGVGKGKKLHDKRRDLKAADAKREVARSIRDRY